METQTWSKFPGEKLSADVTAASEFSGKFLEIIKNQGLRPEQVYNMDETGVNYKMLPKKTFVATHEKSAPGFKLNKERITVALCTNAAGTHKIPLLVIGKSVKPRAFKHLNLSTLPVYYRAQKSAWMDAYLFKEWFITEFVPKVKNYLKSQKLPIKAILVLDNAPTHPGELDCEEDIKLVFLPPNVTSLIQPMDQGVIQSMKRRYRRKFLSEILERTEHAETGLISALKTINIKDVIYMLAAAFDGMPHTTFVKSWRKLWPNVEKIVEDFRDDDSSVTGKSVLEDNPDEDISALLADLKLLPQCEKLEENDVEEWLAVDDQLQNEILTDEEIITAVLHTEENCEEDVECSENEKDITVEKVSHVKAKEALEVITCYIEQQEDVMFMKKWRDFAFNKSIQVKRQKKITHFFK